MVRRSHRLGEFNSGPRRGPVTVTDPLRLSIADRIAALEREIAELRAEQRVKLTLQIALVVGSGHCFSAKELFKHRIVSPALAATFDELGIRNAQQLGKKLKQIGLTRIGEDAAGVVWVL